MRRAEEIIDVRYRSNRDGSFAMADATARVHEHRLDGIDVEIGGRRASVAVTRSSDHLYVQTARGTVTFMVVPRFVVPGLEAVAGSLNAPMPGTILDVRAKVGDRVTKGATLVVMEAMKMEHHISAPLDGEIVDVLVAVGDQVANGAPLLVLEELSDDSVDEAT